MIKIFLSLFFSIYIFSEKKALNYGYCYLFILLIVYIFFNLFCGLGIKIYMGIVGLDTLSLSLIILSFWIRMMIIIRRGLVFKIYFSENKFLLIILLLLFRLLGSFISINILIFYFFFWIFSFSHIIINYRLGISTWANSSRCLFSFLHLNCFSTTFVVLIVYLFKNRFFNSLFFFLIYV